MKTNTNNNKNKIMAHEYVRRYKLFNDQQALTKAKFLMASSYGLAGSYMPTLETIYEPQHETIPCKCTIS